MKKNIIILLTYVSFLTVEIYGQQNKEYQLELAKMSELDQKYRHLGKEGPEQPHLDSSIRMKLDSLYNIHGFPTENMVGVEGQMNMWAVLQHSRDCEFSKRWFYKIVEQYEKGNVSDLFPDLISGTFQRYFIDDASKSKYRIIGFCYKLEPDEIDRFVEKLKTDFSLETLKALGID